MSKKPTKEKTKKVIPPVKVLEITETLKCQLTETEVLAAGQELAEKLQQHHTLEGEKKAVTGQFAAQIKEVDAKVEQKRNLVQNKFEFRPVKCSETHDYKEGTVVVLRLDTSEVVSKRAMTQDERQGKFNFDNND